VTSRKKKQRKVEGKSETAPKKGKTSLGLFGLVVAGLGFVLYINTVNHGYVIDDFSLIKDNWLIQRGVTAIPTILKTSYRYGYWNDDATLYRPLSLVMFAAEWELFPASPAVNHFMNIALYALLGWLLFVTLKGILPGSLVTVSLASLLFIAHPIHTEVVANIKSRDEILSFLLILVAINLLLKYVQGSSVVVLGLAVTCYFLAFLAKESAITFLAVIPLILFFFTEVPAKRNVMISASFGIAALAYVCLRAAVLGDVVAERPIDLLDNVLVSAPDVMSRLATALWLLGRYLVLLLFPHPLVSDYSYKQIQIISPADYRAILSLVVHIALGAYVIARFNKKSLVVFGILFYLITMSIYSNIVITIGSSFAERFLFVPSLGFCIVVAVGIDWMFSKSPGKGQRMIRYGLGVVTALFIIPYGAKTVERNREWRDELTLYSSDVKKSPDSARVHYNYGLVLVKERAIKAGDTAEKDKYLDMAISEFSKAVSIHPSYGDAYNQMGAAYSRKNNYQKALENYMVALKYSPQKAEIHNNLGAVYFYSKEYEKALEVYLTAVKYSPRFADAHRNVGSTYAMLGRLDEAIQAFQRGLEYDPNSAVMHYYLGIIYQKKGDPARAKLHTERAYQLDPSVGK
jgi:Flp pilus assembly protein TadD